MTSKLTSQTSRPERLAQFPDFPPRDDMQNYLHLHFPAYGAALSRHLGNPEITLVHSEIPVYWYPSEIVRIPDLLVAFNVNPAAAIADKGYSIEEQGKPPDFVLEVASDRTARNDYTYKRVDYSNFGILEYWRFDPTGGQRYDAPLAGDRLVDGAYQPIDIPRDPDGNLWGPSAVLNLTLCWEAGKLRWWDPATGLYLLTYDEQDSRRRTAESRLRELEEELRRREPPAH
jgi:hypothetical protein